VQPNYAEKYVNSTREEFARDEMRTRVCRRDGEEESLGNLYKNDVLAISGNKYDS